MHAMRAGGTAPSSSRVVPGATSSRVNLPRSGLVVDRRNAHTIRDRWALGASRASSDGLPVGPLLASFTFGCWLLRLAEVPQLQLVDHPAQYLPDTLRGDSVVFRDLLWCPPFVQRCTKHREITNTPDE